MSDSDTLVKIEPFSYDDPETGDFIEVSKSSEYSKLTINRRTYYFFPETGEFDGASTRIGIDRPILVSGDRS